jgi:hypothetical protein
MTFPIFEAGMLFCFGMAWPVSILKSWRSRTCKGKSLFFLLIVFVGYLSGLTHKLWWQAEIDGVVWLYLLNTFMVTVDGALSIRNTWLDKRRDAQTRITD